MLRVFRRQGSHPYAGVPIRTVGLIILKHPAQTPEFLCRSRSSSHFQWRSVASFTPMRAANSRPLKPLSRHRATRCAHSSREVRATLRGVPDHQALSGTVLVERIRPLGTQSSVQGVYRRSVTLTPLRCRYTPRRQGSCLDLLCCRHGRGSHSISDVLADRTDKTKRTTKAPSGGHYLI
jgi:hypothetical protein